MRYHVCVWASLKGIPFLALAYDDKVKNLAIELKQEYVDLRLPHLSKQIFLDKYNRMNDSYSLFQKEMHYIVPQFINRMQLNSKIVNDSLEPISSSN